MPLVDDLLAKRIAALPDQPINHPDVVVARATFDYVKAMHGLYHPRYVNGQSP
jgi:hypothetical protein